MPAGGKVVSKKEFNEQGFTELTLSNGVRVILKSTDFKNDEILMSAYSPGGTSLCPTEDYLSAQYSSIVVDASGIASFNADAL